MNRPPFTLADAMKIQADNLVAWMPRLSIPCWEALFAKVETENDRLRSLPNPSPYAVFRGDHITNFVANWKP